MLESSPSIKTNYTREELIAQCEKAIVPEERWRNRDSAGAQMKLGRCWALLKAGCAFRILTAENNPHDGAVTNADTIWIEVSFDGFNTFEGSGKQEVEFMFIPTDKCLQEANGEDWY
jgi:hypothetical protein